MAVFPHGLSKLWAVKIITLGNHAKAIVAGEQKSKSQALSLTHSH